MRLLLLYSISIIYMNYASMEYWLNYDTEPWRMDSARREAELETSSRLQETFTFSFLDVFFLLLYYLSAHLLNRTNLYVYIYLLIYFFLLTLLCVLLFSFLSSTHTLSVTLSLSNSIYILTCKEGQL